MFKTVESYNWARGVTRVGVTRGRNWRCHLDNYFPSKISGDLLLVIATNWWPFFSCRLVSQLHSSHLPTSRCPVFFVNSATMFFFIRVSSPPLGLCHPGLSAPWWRQGQEPRIERSNLRCFGASWAKIPDGCSFYINNISKQRGNSNNRTKISSILQIYVRGVRSRFHASGPGGTMIRPCIEV